MQEKISQLNEELEDKYDEYNVKHNNMCKIYINLRHVIEDLSKNTLYTNQREIFKLFSGILLNMSLFYGELEHVVTVDEYMCNNIIADSNIKNQLVEISNGKVITLKHFVYYYVNQVMQKSIDMKKQVLELMNINIDMPRDISNTLQQMSTDEVLTKIRLIIKDVIEPMSFEVEHLKNEIVLIVAKINELYGIHNYSIYDRRYEEIKSMIKTLKELLYPNKTKNDINDNYQYNSDSNKLNEIDNEISNNIKNKNYWNDNNLIISNENFSVVDNEENFNKWNKTNQISQTQSLTF